MACGQLLLNSVLAREQPIHGTIQIVLSGALHAKIFGQSAGMPQARGGQLGRRTQDARCHHSLHQVAFTFARLADSIAAEAALDGLYIIRTSVKAQRMDAATCVRTYKSLAQVERAFRSLKTMDLKVRPIHHHLEGRVRAHIFLCMLAYYVEWHMRQAWRELMFADCDQAAKLTRDPVAPAERSDAAMKKVLSRTLDDGTPTHSFQTLMQDLSTITRNSCRTPNGPKHAPTLQITTTPTARQKRALDLISQIKM